MKHYNKTLLELQYKLDLSKTGTSASCYAASFFGHMEYAKERVSKHRAISKDIRNSINELIKQLDYCDSEVENAYQKANKDYLINKD